MTLLIVVLSLSVGLQSPTVGSIINRQNVSCRVPDGKIPVHIRSIMTRENEEESAEFSVMLEAAAEHVNNMQGLLTGYHICFRYDHAQVRFPHRTPFE